MLLSTAIPIVIAAMVIVIISKGIPNKPIIPKMKKAAIKLGTTPIIDSLIFLNNTTNIAKIPTITKPNVSICDLNKLWSKLLNNIKMPVSLNSSLLSLSLFSRSKLIFLIKSFLLKLSCESINIVNTIIHSYTNSDSSNGYSHHI